MKWAFHQRKLNRLHQSDLTEPVPNLVDLEIDVVGLRCPLPLLKLKKRIQKLKPGSIIRFLANDPTTLKDIPAYCRLVGHEILKLDSESLPYVFFIRMAVTR